MKPCAVIPSRIGSRRITEKNLQTIKGKTLLEWAVDFAVDNHYVPVVSTDSSVVVELCKAIDVKYYISDLHGDFGNSLKIWYEAWEDFGLGDHSLLLEPTSPMRTSNDLDRCVEHLRSDPSICLVRTVEEIKTTKGLAYRFNGAIYAGTPKIKTLDNVYDQKGVDQVVTGFRVNIDTMDDLLIARRILD